MVGWKVFVEVADVPFPYRSGGVANILQNFGDGDLVWMQSLCSFAGEKDRSNAVSVGVTASEQSRARGGADRGGGIEVGKLHTFLGHVIQVWSLDLGGSEDTHVIVALVISEYDDEVGFLCGGD